MAAKRKQPGAEDARVASSRAALTDVRSPASKKARTEADASPSADDETLQSSQDDHTGSSESDDSSQLSESSDDEDDDDRESNTEENPETAPDPALIMPDFSASHVQKPFANRLASFISSIASSNEQLELAKAAGEAVNADFEIESQGEGEKDQGDDEGAAGTESHVDPEGESIEARRGQADPTQDPGGPYIEMNLGLGVLEEQQPGSEHFENAFAGAERWYNDEAPERDDHLLAELTNISRSTSHNERDKRRDKKPAITEIP